MRVLFHKGWDSSVVRVGIAVGLRESCELNTSVGVPESGIPGMVVPLHWRTSCEECKWDVDDSPAGDAVVLCGGDGIPGSSRHL